MTEESEESGGLFPTLKKDEKELFSKCQFNNTQ